MAHRHKERTTKTTSAQVKESSMRRSVFGILLVIVGMVYVIGFGIVLILIGVNRPDLLLIFAGVLVVAAGILGIVVHKQIARGGENRIRQFMANSQQWQEARKRQSTTWYIWDLVQVAFVLIAGSATLAAMFLGRLNLALVSFILWFPGLTVLAGIQAFVTQLAWKGRLSGTFRIVRGAEARRQGVIRIMGGLVGIVVCVVAVPILLYWFANR